MKASMGKATIAGIETYVRSLERLALRAASQDSAAADNEIQIAAALDGQPGEKLRELVTLSARRSVGAFFTGQALAGRALGSYARTLSHRSVVCDPACGMADLLITCARRLPMSSDLATTVTRWGEQLRGLDIQSEFIQAAKARLVLLAVARGARIIERPLPPLAQTFPYLMSGNALHSVVVGPASHIVLNPPYGKVAVPAECSWGSGKMSQAAVFLDRCLVGAKVGTRIVAILPDVLRTGSLYSRWRTIVEARARIDSVEVIGAFDGWADVDVFVTRMVVKEPTPRGSFAWWKVGVQPQDGRVGDRFEVHVGPVVPHRHPLVGHWHPFVHARLLPAWGTFEARTGRRRFRGQTVATPFVAVRRTSAPRDRSRALATIVVGREAVAVENHLLVLRPRDCSLESCRRLLAVLRDDRTNRWLDERIRCRHLTVGVLRELPWWTSSDR